MRNDITPDEEFLISLARLKRLFKVREVTITRRIGRLIFEYKWRSKKNVMGRFGGGWDWNLGIQFGGNTVMFNLLICTVRIFYINKESGPGPKLCGLCDGDKEGK